MKHIKLFEELRPEYYGYLSGTLPYLTKYKSELEKEVSDLQRSIDSQQFMINWGKKFARVPSRNIYQILSNKKEQIKLLKLELEEIKSEISKYSKSKLDENKK